MECNMANVCTIVKKLEAENAQFRAEVAAAEERIYEFTLKYVSRCIRRANIPAQTYAEAKAAAKNKEA